MRIDLGRFIKRKEDYDSENIISPIKDYNRDKYLNRRVFIRILFTLAVSPLGRVVISSPTDTTPDSI